jgi:Bacterial Ig-like domain (group 2)
VSNRYCSSAILFLTLVVPIIGCNNSQVGSIQVTPSSQSLVAGQTAQFTATGIIGHGNHPATNEDVTSQVTWVSNSPVIATVNSSGLATGVSAGSATITATMPGGLSATASISVTGATVSSGNDVVSLSVIPGTQSVSSPKQTSQFIAIGTTAAGTSLDLTGQVMWTSSSTTVATITSGGLATGVGQGSTTITAIATNPDKTVATGTATFTVAAATSEQITALAIIPGSQTLSASGQTGQFIAFGAFGSSGLQEDVSQSPQIKWSSTIPTIASVSPSGLVTGLSAGSSTITAILTNPDGSVLSATASVSVTLTAAPEPLLSLTIVPSALTVGDLQDSGQFLAIGTYSTVPYVRDLTNSVTWFSSFPDAFPVDTNSGGTSSASAGIVTAYGTGTAAIIAEATSPDGTIQTATATFSCPLTLPDPNGHPPTPGSCYTGQGGPLKATLTVYGEGLNTTNWLVTAPSATGTPDVIHCGPGWTANGGTGGSVCVGIYPVGTTVTLTAPAQTGVAFGGWTYNCPATAPITAVGPNSCQIQLVSHGGSTNATVGAIFNNPQ